MHPRYIQCAFLFFFSAILRYTALSYDILQYSTIFYTAESHDLISNKRVFPIAWRSMHDEHNTRTIQSNASLWNSIFLSSGQTFTFLIVLIPYFTHRVSSLILNVPFRLNDLISIFNCLFFSCCLSPSYI